MKREKSHFAPEEYLKRLSLFRHLARREGLDGLLLCRKADVFFACGFQGSSGMAIVLQRSGWLLTDFRYREQAALEVNGLRVFICQEGFAVGLRRILGRRPGRRLGFDSRSITYSEVLETRRKLRGVAELSPLKGDLLWIRVVKSAAEVELMRRGIGIAEMAFKEALGKQGKRTTEKELALEIEFAARREGAEGVAFETIVASGKRGALVHGRPSGGKLAGAVVIDWGIVFEGYCTDCTRTVAFGRVPTELRKAHHLVVEAQERALERIRPGVKAAEVDRAAREVLEKAGYGKAFGHGLGHGVGLEVHEKPHLGPRSMDVLERGMIITVEPGVYLPGLGGVRVEDMVLVTSSGAEVLTRLPRSLDPSDYV